MWVIPFVLMVYTALATVESESVADPATAETVSELLTVILPQTEELATQLAPELVVIAVPVVHVDPFPAVTGEPVVFQQITVPNVEEIVTVVAPA